MVIGMGTVAILAYVWLAWESVQTNLATLLILPADTYDMPFMQAVERVWRPVLRPLAVTDRFCR